MLIEREAEVGGWVKDFGPMFPHKKDGRELIAALLEQVHRRDNIVLFTNAELVRKAGSFGNYEVDIAVAGESEAIQRLEVGSIIVATGFESYQPAEGEYGYGIDGVVTLPEFKAMVDAADGPLQYHGRTIKDVAYIYCVGSRQGDAGPNQYCSRFCCTAAVHASLELNGKDPSAHQYHLYRDMRTYGRFELLYGESREKGALYLKFPAEQPPEVSRATSGKLEVKVCDELTSKSDLRASGRSGGACHRHGATKERRTRQGPQASDRAGRFLQRDPPQASTGRDGRGRCRDLRRLSVPQDLKRERDLWSGGCDMERCDAQARPCRARPAGGHH